jgi:probable H4MPT-linked C1 transfer pathway protein
MTAELSQLFRTKREGVHAVLDAVGTAFPGDGVNVYAADGRFVAVGEARAAPLMVAAANWAAAAHLVARWWRDAILIDVGTTTTDIIPIVGARVLARGRSDPERMEAGELIYTGALRTPAEAIRPGLAAEGFAIAADVHLWRGDLKPEDYSVPTPDGRPRTREFAAERLARVHCADREMLDDAAIDAIAGDLADAQVGMIASGIQRVLAHAPSLTPAPAVVTGVGAFLAARAGQRAGLCVVSLADRLGPAARHAPAAAVALLLAASARHHSLVR